MVSDAHGLSSNDIQKYLQRICDEAGGLMREDGRVALGMALCSGTARLDVSGV